MRPRQVLGLALLLLVRTSWHDARVRHALAYCASLPYVRGLIHQTIQRRGLARGAGPDRSCLVPFSRPLHYARIKVMTYDSDFPFQLSCPQGKEEDYDGENTDKEQICSCT